MSAHAAPRRRGTHRQHLVVITCCLRSKPRTPAPRNPCWRDTERDLSSRWGWVSPSPFPRLQGHQLSGFHVCKLPDSQIRGCLPCTFHLRSGQQSWTRFPHSGAGVWLWGRLRLHCELPGRMEVPGAQVLPYNVWGSLYIRRSGPTVGPAGCTAVGPPGKRRARCRCWVVGWGFLLLDQNVLGPRTQHTPYFWDSRVQSLSPGSLMSSAWAG